MRIAQIEYARAEDILQNLGSALKREREARGVPYWRIAAEAGLAPSTILRAEKGHDVRMFAVAALLHWLSSERPHGDRSTFRTSGVARTTTRRSVADRSDPACVALLGKPLSPREQEILSRVAEGGTAREIAAEFFFSESTVKTHLKFVYAKLGAISAANAVAIAFRKGLIR
jgi:DNA-binding CsgD family transcriptional regulator